jgi:hypothetical protein
MEVVIKSRSLQSTRLFSQLFSRLFSKQPMQIFTALQRESLFCSSLPQGALAVSTIAPPRLSLSRRRRSQSTRGVADTRLAEHGRLVVVRFDQDRLRGLAVDRRGPLLPPASTAHTVYSVSSPRLLYKGRSALHGRRGLAGSAPFGRRL